MLILKYFLTVGAVLIAGLLALNAHLAAPGPISAHKPSTASLPLAAPALVPEKASPVVEPVSTPPKKSAAPSRRSKQSKSGSRASR